MHARSIIAILALIASSMGSVGGFAVQAFCSDSGESGFASSPQGACVAVDCHVGPPATEACADDECCSIDESPAQPLVPHAAPWSLGETETGAHGFLAAGSPAHGNDARLRHHSRGGPSRGPDGIAFSGYALPLLI